MKRKKATNILIVDDEEEVRQSLAEILQLEGLQVTQAPNGYIAIEKAKKNMYDFALIDIKMPGINGLETLSKVLSLQPQIKAVMMTGHPLENRKNNLLKMTCGVLRKPFGIKELMTKIHQAD